MIPTLLKDIVLTNEGIQVIKTNKGNKKNFNKRDSAYWWSPKQPNTLSFYYDKWDQEQSFCATRCEIDGG